MNKNSSSYQFFISIVSDLGGFLFGYNSVVIGGSRPFYKPFFEISSQPDMQKWDINGARCGCPGVDFRNISKCSRRDGRVYRNILPIGLPIYNDLHFPGTQKGSRSCRFLPDIWLNLSGRIFLQCKESSREQK